MNMDLNTIDDTTSISKMYIIYISPREYVLIKEKRQERV